MPAVKKGAGAGMKGKPGAAAGKGFGGKGGIQGKAGMGQKGVKPGQKPAGGKPGGYGAAKPAPGKSGAGAMGHGFGAKQQGAGGGFAAKHKSAPGQVKEDILTVLEVKPTLLPSQNPLIRAAQLNQTPGSNPPSEEPEPEPEPPVKVNPWSKLSKAVALNKEVSKPGKKYIKTGKIYDLDLWGWEESKARTYTKTYMSDLELSYVIERRRQDERTRLLQNTLGGTNITSATPVGLSSHMDPKALAVAAGIGATTFVPLGNNDDGNEERQSSYDTEGQRERSMSDGQEYYGEQEQPEQEERFVSDLMEATTIGENHHKLQFTTSEPAFNHASGQYTPLLDKDPQELASQQPRVQYQKQPEIKFPLTKQDASMACQMNLGDINNYSLQRGTSDGTFCYSIFLIIGVLLMGVGIVLYILQALLGYKAVESIVGGIMFVTGVIVLICSMVGWKRRASQNEKKMIQV